MNPDDLFFALIPLVVIVGLFVLAGLAILRSTRLRELKHKEWMALVEKGIVPPPEMTPPAAAGGGLKPDALGGLEGTAPTARSAAAERFRSAGVVFVGLGAAIALIIGVAASAAQVGIGIGGAVAVVGAALFVNGTLMGRRGDEQSSRSDAGPAPGGL